MSGFLYRRTGDVYAPTQWAGSPWSRELQHGGPVNGLIASAAEAAAAETGLRVVRLSVDLFRPTPLEPLALAWQRKLPRQVDSLKLDSPAVISLGI